MADSREIEATYDYMDELFRLTFGDHADITAALFAGDRTKTLEAAQRDKHRFVLEAIGFAPGFRVLDIGCGWGPMLAAIRAAGGTAVGLTLSPAQARACVAAGLDARVEDWRAFDRGAAGRFDAIVCIGAFEHFCSKADYAAGRQEKVYGEFFAACADLLAPGGALFLQTMLWGTRGPDRTEYSLRSLPGSDERLLAVLDRFYPGSWLPQSLDQVAACAEPFFALAKHRNGREDYIETMKRWDRVWRPSRAKLAPAARLALASLRRPDLLFRVECLAGSYNRRCFERSIMDHERILFVRRDP